MRMKNFFKLSLFLSLLASVIFIVNIAMAYNGPLSGKTIVIDPGHGGAQFGAVGEGGLKESELNLKVSFFLEAMLKEKGANVIMTRNTDAQCIETTETSDDLKARAMIANNNNANLFISIHHNSLGSDARLKADKTEVYYRFLDDGASFDFAKILLKNLTRNVNGASSKISPANYAVLRNNTRPAALGEANYISNPSLEKLFTTEEFQKKEALGYYESVMEYFALGVPYIEPIRFTTQTYYNPLSLETSIIDTISKVADPEIYLDNEKQKGDWDGTKLSLTINTPLKSGSHSLLVKARNANGNSAIPLIHDFIVSRPAMHMETEGIPSALSPSYKGVMWLKAHVTDTYGLPIIDNTPVSFCIGDKTYTSRTLNGYAYCYPGIENIKENISVKVSCENTCGQIDINTATTDKSSVMGTIKSSVSLIPVPEVKCMLDKETGIYTNSDGMFAYGNLKDGKHTIDISCKGYKTATHEIVLKSGEFLNSDIQAEPFYNGVLQGKRIVLDPTYSSNSTINNANMEVAFKLKELLEQGGANVMIVRKNINDNPEMTERVRTSIKFKPDIAYVISHEDKKFISQYYTTTNPLGFIANKYLGGVEIRKTSDFVITHTPCPILILSFGPVTADVMKEPEMLLQATVEYCK